MCADHSKGDSFITFSISPHDIQAAAAKSLEVSAKKFHSVDKILASHGLTPMVKEGRGMFV